MQHPSGNVWLTGDNRTGAGDGDDEQIIVKLDQLDQSYQKIVFWLLFIREEAIISILE
jgi:stress response protein SCP2